MTDTPKESPDARLKALTDIWMHQNRLMWSRLQTMLIMQITFFGAGYTLAAMKYYAIVFLPFVFAILATAVLLHISHVDRAVRNRFERRLADEYNIHIRLLEGDPDDQAAYLAVAWNSLRWVGSTFYMNWMFYIAIVIDLFAAWLLTTQS